MTEVVNLYKEPYDVYIGRAGKGQDGYFGNPFPLTPDTTRGEVLEDYYRYFYKRIETDSEFKKRILSLRGKKLGCFCKPQLCHGDVIKSYLDSVDEDGNDLPTPEYDAFWKPCSRCGVMVAIDDTEHDCDF